MRLVCVGDSPKLSTYTNFNVLSRINDGWSDPVSSL